MTKAQRILLVIATALSITSVFADDQITKIEQAWNRGDTLAAQSNFSREISVAPYMAEFAKLAESGKKVTLELTKPIAPNLYAIKAKVGDETQTWVIKDNDKGEWTWFGYMTVSTANGAELGQGFDVATTGAGLGMGAAEANPLGLAVILPMKVGMLAYSRNAGFEDCVGYRASLDSLGWGAGIANIATLVAGIPFPVSLITLAAVSMGRWEAAARNAVFECATFELERV